ncbi:MAG: hypothetical protein WA144_15485 [Candidatus Methanoperedens sp.]
MDRPTGSRSGGAGMSAATIDQWTERMTIPQDWKGLRFFGILDVEYDILIKERVTDEDNIYYYTAWVNLGNGELKKHYQFESDRKGYYIAVDTYELAKLVSGTFIQKDIIKERMAVIVKEHLEYQKEVK